MEAKLKFRLETINPWAPEEAFLDLCAEGTPPALTDVTSAGCRGSPPIRRLCAQAAKPCTAISNISHGC